MWIFLKSLGFYEKFVSSPSLLRNKYEVKIPMCNHCITPPIQKGQSYDIEA